MMILLGSQLNLKIIFLSCGVLLVMVATSSYYFLLRTPLLQWRYANQQQQLAKQQFAANYQIYLEEIALNNLRSQWQKQYATIVSIIQMPFRLQQYLQDLAVIFQQYHVVLINLKPEQRQNNKLGYIQVLQLQLQDQSGELFQALYSIQQLPYLSMISQIQIHIVANASSITMLQADLSLKVYFCHEV